MIRVSTGHYVVFCSDCTASDREEAGPGERTASRRRAVLAFTRRGWRERESSQLLLSQRGLGMGGWQCPACAGPRQDALRTSSASPASK